MRSNRFVIWLGFLVVATFSVGILAFLLLQREGDRIRDNAEQSRLMADEATSRAKLYHEMAKQSREMAKYAEKAAEDSLAIRARTVADNIDLIMSELRDGLMLGLQSLGNQSVEEEMLSWSNSNRWVANGFVWKEGEDLAPSKDIKNRNLAVFQKDDNFALQKAVKAKKESDNSLARVDREDQRLKKKDAGALPSTSEPAPIISNESFIVDQVSSNSPAADSGLKLHDVLLQLDEQILVNSAQLKALVQMKDSGDIITLKILRKGKPKILKVTLSEIERQLPRHGNHFTNPLDLDVFTENQLHSDFESLFPHLDPSILNLLKKHGFSQIPNGPNSRIRNKRFFDFENPVHGSGEGNTESYSYSSKQRNIIMSDENGTIEFSEKGGQKWLKVKDSEGEIIHDGPVNTEQQIQELPISIREKLLKMDLSL